jgi:hypothetical protein
MGEWMAIAHWQDCAKFARPGIVFELRNADGNILVADCSDRVPTPPHDWKSPPIEFRAVVEAKPEHSSPIPPPLTR